MAILAELKASPPEPGSVWGVWTAHPPGPDLHAQSEGSGWRLNGVKQFCSGARVCTHALVSALVSEAERQLFAVRAEAAVAAPDTWAAAGMAASDTLTLIFDDVAAEPVGRVGDYIARPGFHHGGIGVAACWYGGALAVSQPLATQAASGNADVQTRARYGAIDRELYSAETVLRRAAEEVDADPEDYEAGAKMRAMRVRAVVASACAGVLRHTGEALGAGPLAFDPHYAHAVEDLAVYLRQHRGDRDLAGLGTAAAAHEGGTDVES